jgi:hypothetical protein
MASRQEFAAVMAYLGAAVGKDPTREQAEVYYDLLGNLPGPVLQQAARRAAMEHKICTLPPPGLIREHANAVAGRADATALADGWAKVRAFARRWEYWLTEGNPTDPKTLARMAADRAAIPPLALRAAEAYGWRTIVESNPEVAFAHFRQLHESLDVPARREALMPPVAEMPAALSGRLRLHAIGEMDDVA